MKLIECYVNNFGKLSGFSYKFSEGLNVICRENGFGKTTLSDFIKAMLFGLEDTRRTAIAENDRRRYEPWQGGAWGGSLSFSYKGREYRIERSFGNKAALDETTVYDLKTGKITSDFQGGEPGEVIFGIDRDGFERTVFLSEKEIDERKPNHTVTAKLSRLTGVAFDMTELEAAMKLLEEERKFLYKQSGNGIISETSDKISELEFRRASLATLERKHESDAERISLAEAEIKLLRERAKSELEVEKQAAIANERHKEYLAKQRELDELSESKRAICELFSGKLPEKETLYELESASLEIARAERENERLRAEISSSQTLPKDEELDKCALLALRVREDTKKLATAKERELSAKPERTRAARLAVILGAVLAAIGLALGFVLTPLFAIAALGALIAVFGIFAKKKTSGAYSPAETLALEFEISKNKDELFELLSAFGIAGTDTELAISELKKRKKENEGRLSALHEKEERLLEYKDKREAIFASYPVTRTYPVRELITKLDTYRYLSQNAERLARELEEFKKKLAPEEKPEALTSREGESAAELLRKKEREITLLKNEFSTDELSLSELDEIASSIDGLNEELAGYKYKLETVKKTKNYLEAAKDSLTSKYLGKTKAAFNKYADIISGEENELGLDTSLAITKTEVGKTHVKDAFSKGTRELYDFAIRLSLSDSLYDGDSPFLMLDDPFAYFDDKKLPEAKALLRELAKEKQIIYFTPTEARA